MTHPLDPIWLPQVSAQLEMLIRMADAERLSRVDDPGAEDRAKAEYAARSLSTDERLNEAAGSGAWVSREARLHVELAGEAGSETERLADINLVKAWAAAVGLAEPNGAHRASRDILEARSFFVPGEAEKVRPALDAAMTERLPHLKASLEATVLRARQQNLLGYTRATVPPTGGNVVDIRAGRPVRPMPGAGPSTDPTVTKR